MVRGIRNNATVINPQVQPQAAYTYDPITRRAVRYVETVVPTMADAGTVQGSPADRYYINFGALKSFSSAGHWWNIPAGSSTFSNWDSTNKRSYTALIASSTASNPESQFYYAGNGGTATDHAPKNATVSQLELTMTLQFPDNIDYNTLGIGLSNSTNFTAGNHSIQVLRNTTAWELGTSDGSTTSQSSGGTGDGNWHVFKVVWTSASLTLYVDGVSTITKTTNRPDRSLSFCVGSGGAGSGQINIHDYLVTWS